MIPKVWIYTICWNEAQMMPFFLRHYSTFADKIIVYDEQSTDGTRDIIKSCPKAELREWTHKGLDDDKFLFAVNNYWKEAKGKADWIMWPDVDEILHHPEPLKVLSQTKLNVLLSQGFALISKEGFPQGNKQIYELVDTGYPQSNYDKYIIWKPGVTVVHDHGRHRKPLHCNGLLDLNYSFKLLHCHHIGGVGYTVGKNARNYDRAVDKRFAWNYSEEHYERIELPGTVGWIKNIIDNNLLQKII